MKSGLRASALKRQQHFNALLREVKYNFVWVFFVAKYKIIYLFKKTHTHARSLMNIVESLCVFLITGLLI